MEKLYANPSKNDSKSDLKPRQETIDFLLNFSKSIDIKKYNAMEVEVNLN